LLQLKSISTGSKPVSTCATPEQFFLDCFAGIMSVIQAPCLNMIKYISCLKGPVVSFQWAVSIQRFPPDFMFQLNREELENWKSQIVISNPAAKMALRKLPRAFIRMRKILASNADLACKVQEHDRKIAVLFDTVQKLLSPPDQPKKNPIGYIHPKDC
jgi:hypothetical protein